ncbi:MAG: CoA pyrophosphatase [Candidatus Limnocylindrales bacterium]|jgi:8-oxo-dGTP pyrophosphatase MutT (NUDIX family)/GNAT superfamily N-acetyltransferase
MRFELVRERLEALPRELPAAPAILTPIRLDSPEEWVPMAAKGQTGGAARNTGRGRPSAVLVLLFPDAEGQARVLLTARSSHISAHAGEVSFPGGSADEGDEDPIATAVRETVEEVGLDPAACGLRVTGVLEVFALTVSGFRITPVVALAERRPECHPAPDEVARVVEAPVEAFLPDAPVELEERTIRQRLIRYGVYPVEGERVWGATARMLGQLGALLAARRAVEPGPAGPSPAEPGPAGEPIIRAAMAADEQAIHDFLEALAPELAHDLPPASELLLAEVAGRVAGVAGWAPWDRDRPAGDPRGFEGLDLPEGDRPAELTLLAVAPHRRGRGIGRGLTAAVAGAAGIAGNTRLLAWTLADSDVHPSSIAARAFFRSNGFTDLAVDRCIQTRGEDRLLLSRTLG